MAAAAECAVCHQKPISLDISKVRAVLMHERAYLAVQDRIMAHAIDQSLIHLLKINFLSRSF